MRVDYFNIIHSAMVYHPHEFETAVTLGQNEPLYCNVPDSLSESLARARLIVELISVSPATEKEFIPFLMVNTD